MADYPEHDKLHLISDKSQIIGEFLDWCSDEHEWFLAEHDKDDECYECGNSIFHAPGRIDNWLAEFFNIDRDVLENEKRAMLDVLRKNADA